MYVYVCVCVCVCVCVLYIRCVQLLVKIGKRHLPFSKRLGRQLISLKILISNS